MTMAFLYVHGACIACQTPLSFHPDYVPSIRVNGEREPLCPRCADTWNEIHRTSKGLPPISVHQDAYEPLEVN